MKGLDTTVICGLSCKDQAKTKSDCSLTSRFCRFPTLESFVGVKDLEESIPNDRPDENQVRSSKFKRRPESRGDVKRLWRGCKTLNPVGFLANLDEAGIVKMTKPRFVSRHE